MNLFYFTDVFPKISEIFISREIAGLENIGVRINLLSNLDPCESINHELNRKLRVNPQYYSKLNPGKIKKGLCHIKYFMYDFNGYLGARQRSRVQGLPEMKYLFRQIPLVCDLVRKSGADHIHCHHGRGGMLTGWLVSRMLRMSFSVTLHGTDILCTPYANLGVVLQDADMVVCVSDKIRNVVQVSYGISTEKTTLIRCGVPVKEFNFQDKFIPDLKILSVARLTPIKGLSILIQACAILRDRNVSFTCTIIGDGEEKEKLQSAIDNFRLSGIVKLLGSLPNEILPDIYSAHSLFVLPSYSEGVGVVNMEAMACGLPVIASNVGGIPEIVTDCRNGFLVAPGKSDQIADAVMKYLQMSSEGIETMRLDNRRKVELEFNSEVENEKLYKIFKELIGRNPRWA